MKYAEHFKQEFPLYEYIEVTASEGYDKSIKGAFKLRIFIDDCIPANEPVSVPEGYWERDY
ncbi:hypothetical protein [Enterococcus faecalis]|uniref:hypothetical protein n=1 Tax=Enterococcus faecalis TaxID=1351 RepID=UPI0025B1DA18|nr:hypothetical protein [Enterococcus faecalis]MDN3168395.1 hypothetical protein [Enterococcus faecalis]